MLHAGYSISTTNAVVISTAVSLKLVATHTRNGIKLSTDVAPAAAATAAAAAPAAAPAAATAAAAAPAAVPAAAALTITTFISDALEFLSQLLLLLCCYTIFESRVCKQSTFKLLLLYIVSRGGGVGRVWATTNS